MVKQTLTPFELIYGLISAIYGIPSIEGVLAGEILNISQGGLQVIFGILFALISIFGIYALFDGLCRLFFNKTGVRIIEIILENLIKFIEWIKERV
jgi:hypothetical protein